MHNDRNLAEVNPEDCSFFAPQDYGRPSLVLFYSALIYRGHDTPVILADDVSVLKICIQPGTELVDYI